MVQNRAELDKIILESQDFPEVNVKKGINCWEEEFSYLVKNILFDSNTEIAISMFGQYNFGKRLSKDNDFFLDICLQRKEFYLGKKTRIFPFSKWTYNIAISSADTTAIIQKGRNQPFSPITIQVYDKEFFEPAKLFAKAYKKWCGQEATVTKEYVETEEKAQEMVRLENIIEESKRTGKGNINELEDIPETTFERPEGIRQGEILSAFNELIDKAVKKYHKDRAYSLVNSWVDNDYSQRNYRVYKRAGYLLKYNQKYAGSITVKIFPNFSAPKETTLEITTNINSKCDVDYLLAMSNKLKQELNAPVKIIQNY